jgi:hypothetical protein
MLGHGKRPADDARPRGPSGVSTHDQQTLPLLFAAMTNYVSRRSRRCGAGTGISGSLLCADPHIPGYGGSDAVEAAVAYDERHWLNLDGADLRHTWLDSARLAQAA